MAKSELKENGKRDWRIRIMVMKIRAARNSGMELTHTEIGAGLKTDDDEIEEAEATA